jgi:hypothetical protein
VALAVVGDEDVILVGQLAGEIVESHGEILPEDAPGESLSRPGKWRGGSAVILPRV